MQNKGLRIILGAMRSSPIQQMDKIADLQPFECRREYKAAIPEEKLKRRPVIHSTRNFSTKKA